jgi:hypothetical protein
MEKDASEISLTSHEVGQLIFICQKGLVRPKDLIDEESEKRLLELGLVARIDGWSAITGEGLLWLKMAGLEK